MTQPRDAKDTISQMIERLLSGPARPGQAFTMPGTNYDGLYRMARRIKAFMDSTTDDNATRLPLFRRPCRDGCRPPGVAGRRAGTAAAPRLVGNSVD